MKTPKIINNKCKLTFLATAGVSLGLAMNAVAQNPVAVDTELLLLVDISGSVNSSEYGLMMDGYADSFNDSKVLTAIEKGKIGAIAVSLMFWSGASNQSVGIGWTLINDQASSQAFSTAISNLVRPFSGSTAIGSAIEEGTKTFGTETGNAENGFSSITQIIDISGDGEDNDTPPAGDRALNVRNARDAAIVSGVDMINALPIGNAGGDLKGYYESNVVAGSAGEVAAFAQTTNSFSDVETSLTLKLESEITAGAKNSTPEPKASSLVALGLLAFAFRRKK